MNEKISFLPMDFLVPESDESFNLISRQAGKILGLGRDAVLENFQEMVHYFLGRLNHHSVSCPIGPDTISSAFLDMVHWFKKRGHRFVDEDFVKKQFSEILKDNKIHQDSMCRSIYDMFFRMAGFRLPEVKLIPLLVRLQPMERR